MDFGAEQAHFLSQRFQVLYNLGRGSSKAVVEELALKATAFLDSIDVCEIPSMFEVCRAEMISAEAEMIM